MGIVWIMKKLYPNLFCISSMVLWAASFPAKDILLKIWDPLFLYAFGLVIASVITLAIWLTFEGTKEVKKFPWLQAIIIGGIGFGIGGCFFIFAQSLSGAVTVAIAAAFMPIFATMIEIIMDGRSLNIRFIVGVFISILGGLVMTLGSDGGGYNALGLLIALPAVILFAWASRQITKSLPGFSNLAQGSISILGAGLAVSIPYFALNNGIDMGQILTSLNISQVLCILIFAATGISISQVLWIKGVSQLGIAMASIHMNSAPFYVMLFVFLLGGSWIWVQFWALILVVIGVLLTQIENSKFIRI